ncbi:hypothetical protein [Alistipes senegalensis]|uniref:hypothetical protein n=1 Tax=Alistipes senegalensis TaxID=1288121 RepID=UPI00101BD0C0|nr:hypothetical protein [Alistipes senegalensis]
MKAKVDKPALCSVRISKAAKGKLEIIAERKGVSLGNAVSLIILHYAANNLDYEVSVNDAYKTILNKLTGVDIKFSKIIGPVERTEDFIKSLVREDRRSASGSFSGTSQDMDVSAPSSDDRLPRSLGLLERLFSIATRTTDFEGHAAMQIRLSQSDFNQFKREYEELCTSRSI